MLSLKKRHHLRKKSSHQSNNLNLNLNHLKQPLVHYLVNHRKLLQTSSKSHCLGCRKQPRNQQLQLLHSSLVKHHQTNLVQAILPKTKEQVSCLVVPINRQLLHHQQPSEWSLQPLHPIRAKEQRTNHHHQCLDPHLHSLWTLVINSSKKVQILLVQALHSQLLL